MAKRSDLIREAKQWGIAAAYRMTVASLEAAIREAKQRALEEAAFADPELVSEPEVAPVPEPAVPAAPEPAPPAARSPVVDEWPAGHYRALCNVITPKGDFGLGSVVDLDAASAESLGSQGAIERI